MNTSFSTKPHERHAASICAEVSRSSAIHAPPSPATSQRSSGCVERSRLETRDASTAEFYESLFGAEDEDDALTKRRGGSFLKKEPVTPLSPTPPKTNCF